MKYLFTFFALFVLVIPPAQARENRISVTDIYQFISSTNHAINNSNLNAGQSFLNRTTAENAIFENRVSSYKAANPWQPVWYNNPAYGTYYRYPVNPYYNQVSQRSLRKWDHINLIESKKRMIPGYQADIEITDTTINPYGQSAVVDVDLKEYSLAYSPYSPTLTARVLGGNSKCKMYLSRTSRDLLLTRMDCNTNTNLPL